MHHVPVSNTVYGSDVKWVWDVSLRIMYKCIMAVSEQHERFILKLGYSFSYYFSDFMYSWIPDLLRHWCMNCQKPRLNKKYPLLLFLYGKYAFMLFIPIIYLICKRRHIYTDIAILDLDVFLASIIWELVSLPDQRRSHLYKYFIYCKARAHSYSSGFHSWCLSPLTFIPHIERDR